jgi:uncharacterized membrane protein
MRSHESLVGMRLPGPREPAGIEMRRTGNPGSLTEWTARPLGRLGRPLVAEIESYLTFFSIARAEADRDS